MTSPYIVRGKKIVTVSSRGTIENGAMRIENGKVADIGTWERLRKESSDVHVMDYSNYVITPSLVDCHTHLLEYAPTSLYPVTIETHFWAAKAILFHALSSGITALGEQICGHPVCDIPIEAYRKAVLDLPIDISFATASISIGFEKMAHFTSITQSSSVDKTSLNDLELVRMIAEESDYPGENIFINATPANFKENDVPKAGEMIYTLEVLKQIVKTYHKLDKKIGAHVAGEVGIDRALEAGVDVLHHAHGITDELLVKAVQKGVEIVATPMGGTHLKPNSPEEILKMIQLNIPVSISTDAYLPPYKGTSWLPFQNQELRGPDVLMLIAQPAMQLLKRYNYDENEILALLTANPATILGKGNRYGRLEKGLEANFLVSEGIPGLEITQIEKVKKVFFQGRKVIERT
ncbi:amidohydrolase family protein [Sporosarcina sp. G11-34]|uniref:amidohydrolase family protein n=1 Tax=Sporosarcina sp. G11-34 TaxID=2849605 RepID=UPI0022A973E0|nr:amidohydrolase family protein [Sporosarcina sp. G11-34]MCZ2258214.1 amidohydrolase family protein [Sporosarcina sp. G11-34]